jgi:hypothetical protein
MTWHRANRNRYRNRDTCQRACDWLNRRLGAEWWYEPVIALDGDHFEMWAARRAEAWEHDPDEPEAGMPDPPDRRAVEDP